MWAEAEHELGFDNPFADPQQVAELREKLSDDLMGSEKRTKAALSELDEFRAELGDRRHRTRQEAAPGEDLEDIRGRLRDGRGTGADDG